MDDHLVLIKDVAWTLMKQTRNKQVLASVHAHAQLPNNLQQVWHNRVRDAELNRQLRISFRATTVFPFMSMKKWLCSNHLLLHAGIHRRHGNTHTHTLKQTTTRTRTPSTLSRTSTSLKHPVKGHKPRTLLGIFENFFYRLLVLSLELLSEKIITWFNPRKPWQRTHHTCWQ